MQLRIPPSLAEKANRFPESSYGATTVTLILADGRRIKNVVLGWAEWVVKIDGRMVADASELDFTSDDIVNVVRQDQWWRWWQR